MAGVTVITKNGETLADLLERLGNVPLARIPCIPPPGTATEEDVLAYHNATNRLCELVDGVLVEKAMGFYGSLIAAALIQYLREFVTARDLGVVAAPDGMMRLAHGLVRMPDVSFVSWDQLGGRRVPREPIPSLFPDLAVEILSESNTPAEIQRKLTEYFAAGARLTWIVDPHPRTVRVYTAPDQFDMVTEDSFLDGGEVLPGFSLPLRRLFEEAGERGRD